MQRVLIIDDEPNVLYSFGKALRSSTLEVLTAETAADGLRQVRESKPDTVILDVRLPDMSGLDALDEILAIDSRLPVIVVTAYSSSETAIEAMRRGAMEHFPKPVDVHQLQAAVAKALELSRLQHVPAIFGNSDDQPPGDRIVGRSEAMQEVYKGVGRVAAEDVTVLILGETGTGKELIARAIYHYSHRADQPFLAINCAALPDTLLESELFGHERGAFTGAERQRIGKFEQAHGGTIFLDEVGDMSVATQAKVLRVLQDGSFQRVGGSKTIQADVRVLAATNQNLDTKIDSAEFRQDLLYRLNGFTVHLPPLRDRREDLPDLVQYFLGVANRQVNKPAFSISSKTMELLQHYDWPGNVRELQSVIKYSVVHAVSDTITPDCLPETCRGRAAQARCPRPEDELAGISRYVRLLLESGESDIYRKVQATSDRLVLAEVLRHVRGNQVHASEHLGMSRTTLRSKLQALGMLDEDFA
jgi:nitrogen regulation protein NR(I)